MGKINVSFHLEGNVAFCELERFLPLTFLGKRGLPLKIKEAIKDVTGFNVKQVVFCKLQDLGLKKDKFFQVSVDLPKNFIRQPRKVLTVTVKDLVSA